MAKAEDSPLNMDRGLQEKGRGQGEPAGGRPHPTYLGVGKG